MAADWNPRKGDKHPPWCSGGCCEQDDPPTGAVVNGRICIERLENTYSFECEAGPLAMCDDWQRLRQCFEHLVEYISRPAASGSSVDPLALALEALEVVEVADLVKGVYVLDKQDMAVVLMALKALRGAQTEGAAP